MPVLYLDFETFYSAEYTLKTLTPPEYILDPRYETIGCAVAVDNEPSHWVDGPDFAKYLDQFDPHTTQTVTFNALFDNCILAWRYGFIPARMYCSMRLAAALRGHVLSSVSLSNVARTLKLGEKGDTIVNVLGMRRSEIMNNPTLWHQFHAYANNDNELNRAIFKTLLPEFPAAERKVMDRVIRCAVEPRLSVDTAMLRQHLDELVAHKALALHAAGLSDPSDLRSAAKFEDLLRNMGVEIEYKPSGTDPERKIPAFAKTDAFMGTLLEHEDPTVQAMAAARLGVRSTIEESRGERIMSIASLPWPGYCGGNMPIPLRYSGAHTHRLSGEWKINMQNLPAGRGTNKSKLRKALIAPPGHKVLVADLSQIECRIAAWICDEADLLSQFANKKDPYSILATKIFGFIVDKKVHLLERFIGKSGVLGLGFGCGAEKFYNMVLRSARGMGMDMTKLLAVWTPELAQRSVDTYRKANPNIKRAWYDLGAILDSAWCGATVPVRWGPGGVVEIGHGYVKLPNDMKLVYDVQSKNADGHWYKYGRLTYRMYGPKFLENIVQALARIVVMNAALRLWDRGYKFCLQSHDELAFVVRTDDADNAKAIVLEEMKRPPSWAPNLPLDAEANYGDSYGDAK